MSLAERAVRGAVWSVATSVGARLVGLAGSLLLTRFLSPDLYGDVSLASVVILTATTVSNCGISQYIVSRPHNDRSATFHASAFFLVLGAVALAIALVVGAPFGAAIRAPGLARYLPGLAVAAFVERIATIQDRILVRDMRFRTVGILRSLGEVVYSGTSVALAALGVGAWYGGGTAVVLASIARSTVRLIGLSWVTPWREWASPVPLSARESRRLLAFGGPMSIATLAGFGSRRWDNFVYAALFGGSAAGVYNLAYNLADIPATQLADTLGDVLVPSFAAMSSADRRHHALLLAMRQMTFLVSPLSVGLGLVAPTLVETFLDPRWAAVAPALALLAGLSVVRPIAWIGSAYLQVANRPAVIMAIETAKTVGILAMMVIFGRGIPWLWGHSGGALDRGEQWACLSVGVSFGLGSLAYMWVFWKTEAISLGRQLADVLPSTVACVPMAVGVVLLRRMLEPFGLSPGMRLGAEILVGIAMFVPSAFVIAPRASKEFLALLGTAVRSRARPR